MPVQKGKSALAAKLGGKLDSAHEQHKDDELTLQGGGNLPEGIDQGIAQLVMMKFDVYKSGDYKGEYYFMAQGVVMIPKAVRGIPVAGERTKIGPEPICDTPNARGKRKTLADHYGHVLNEIRKFGVDTSKIKGDQIEAIAEKLQSQKPYFKFRTWKGEPTEEFPDPRVNEDWRGICDYNPEAVDDVQDNSGDASASTDVETSGGGESGGEAPLETIPGPEEPDFESLASTADDPENSEKDIAANRIVEACHAAGIPSEETDVLPNWAAVVKLLRERAGGNGQTSEAEFIPKAKQVQFYKPPKAKKAVECEITAVFNENKTVNLKNLDDGKTIYKGVPWNQLLQGT